MAFTLIGLRSEKIVGFPSLRLLKSDIPAAYRFGIRIRILVILRRSHR